MGERTEEMLPDQDVCRPERPIGDHREKPGRISRIKNGIRRGLDAFTGAHAGDGVKHSDPAPSSE